MTFSILLTLLVAAIVSVEVQGGLLVLDRVMNGDLVESINVTVTYTIHNVGKR